MSKFEYDDVEIRFYPTGDCVSFDGSVTHQKYDFRFYDEGYDMDRCRSLYVPLDATDAEIKRAYIKQMRGERKGEAAGWW